MMKIFAVLGFLFFINTSHAQQDGYAQANGVRIYYRSFGKGTPILIINGGPGMNSDGFAGLAQSLSSHHRTIIFDQRGTGRSGLDKIDTGTITMQLMADDIEQLREHLQIDRWIILGHSFGGMLASYYATLHPEHIMSMILSSSGGIDLSLLSNGNPVTARLSAAQSDSLDYWNKKITDGDTSFAARLGRGRALAPAYVFDPKNIPSIAERLTQGNSIINALVWRNMQKIKFDCAPGLSSFTKPVLIIQGKQDIVNETLAAKAHSILKNSKLVLLDNCVHYGWLDRPDVYFKEIEDFLRQN